MLRIGALTAHSQAASIAAQMAFIGSIDLHNLHSVYSAMSAIETPLLAHALVQGF